MCDFLVVRYNLSSLHKTYINITIYSNVVGLYYIIQCNEFMKHRQAVKWQASYRPRQSVS